MHPNRSDLKAFAQVKDPAEFVFCTYGQDSQLRLVLRLASPWIVGHMESDTIYSLSHYPENQTGENSLNWELVYRNA